MKRILLLLSCLLFVTGSCFAKELPIPDLWSDFFDNLPWSIEEEVSKTPDKAAEEKREETAPSESETAAGAKKVNSVDLVIILDKSGSMYSMTEDTIGGFNSLLDEQRKKDVPVKVSLGVFNQTLEAKYDRKDIKEIENMTAADYVPQGTTALLDAVGNTLSALKERPEVNAKGNKVLVVIITDGMENASKEWKKDSVKNLISELKEKGYEFVFLGADIDAVAVAEGIGINAESSMKFRKTGAGVQANFKAINVMMEAVSSGGRLMDNANWKKSIVEDK